MSFAIFKTGGKQYKVQASEILKIEKLELSKDNKIEFNEILAYGDKKNVELGFPLIKGAKIEAELIKNSKERTVLVFKKRRRKNSRKKYGHRQPFTLIRINKIFSKDGKILASAEKKTEKTLKVIKENEKKKTIIKKKK
jgi:large subunit ribosomal protein L21|tara:strand:- start:1653 stop:2069 length:417 start_codon:yes stop_codon:yes gene_type:complete